MLQFLTVFILCLALQAPPAQAETPPAAEKTAPAPEAKKSPTINLYVPPEAAKAEEIYDGIVKNLTKEQQDLIKAYESDFAKTADVEMQIASTALKLKYCSEHDSAIAKNPGKYTSNFHIYRNQLQAQQRDERLKIRKRQMEEITFIDQKTLDGHFDYTANLVFQVGFQIVKMNYEKGEFKKTDCAAVAESLNAAAKLGNPITGTIETAPDKLQEIQRLANNTDPEGMFMLGMLQITGNGMPKDAASGLNWLKKAADKGHERAQLVLGVGMTTDMFGIPPDPQEAQFWLEKAAAQGNTQAEAALEKLHKQDKK